MKIGLEIHVQLPTRSKMFCSCPTTDAPAPNTHVCPVCLGMPGSRPVLNRQVLVYGIMLAKMLGCTVTDTTWFSRKTYFYPDMSKSVQITQYDHPVGERGMYYLNAKDGQTKPIRITRIHLEEDPGKTKRTSDMHALVDYNRSGIPLAEIVTEPDLTSPAEARAFLTQLVQDIRHTIDLPEGGERSIRCDCNISVGKERCEIKNVTGLKNVEVALNYEMVRQIKVLKAGGKIERATMNFDESRGVTYGARKKEFEADYGYIDEPDLGIFHIADLAKSIRIKESPAKMIQRITGQYELDPKMAKQLVSTSIDLAQFFETVIEKFGKDDAVKWVAGPVTANWKKFEERDGNVEDILPIIEDFVSGRITDTECTLKIKSLMTGIDAAEAAASSEGLDKMISDFLDKNPKIVDDYGKGNEKAANSVIGYVMKSTGGQYSSADIVDAAKRIIKSRL